MIKEKRQQKKRRKYVLVLCLNLLALILVAGVCVVTVFTVKKVTVKGNRLYEDEVIRESILNDKYSWNSLYVYLKYKFSKPESIPFVDTMEITLKPPHEIRITVYEKGIVGYVYMETTGQNAYFDKDGIVVEISADLIEDAVQVRGLEFEQVVLYDKLPVEDKTIFKSLLSLSHSLEKYSLMPKSLKIDEKNNIVLRYGKIRVIFGNTENLNEKVLRLNKIMPSIKKLSGTLHMENWIDNASDITFIQNKK
ncbi:MAG: cell division protein FtsQ/DivIB [Lachnospiraceae bacterium]